MWRALINIALRSQKKTLLTDEAISLNQSHITAIEEETSKLILSKYIND
jgi:hypothetical protein